MVIRPSRTGLLVAVATSLLFASSAHGNDYRDAVVGGAGLPSVVPGIGTFAGSISAVRVRGTGIYFAIEGSRRKMITYRPPVAKIIEVGADMENSACSFEAGVCVIRPR
ncbi:MULTISPECIES: hypothetical protein [Alphaproteobacteria]|uniref:Uncharacterized protein n=2 Tax=Alphaproteobacteria TaxID=28211 RepID=A0A512HJX7_9HYPH|nr:MULTISPECIES: hypothetical protein [Alphaproteobacteria]GEO85735.1 hypothetical protein RNA01_26670 [Ciceribacter naphthalenivorans]GLR21905.1 hypothetical protein GCM10007920_16920 [Ciceribacter naphthalenivorans]GLT04761.1 hypothetical protein GCM10007926_16920 [Sphingomonas psychrolutea]